MNKVQLKRILLDIRFWIIIFFILRLVGITNAPLEVGHNWRQTLTNMIARNFLEKDANILYPTIDMAGEKTGIIGTEFPFFNYLIYIYSYFFDHSHWAGRLINLIVSSSGLYFFYKLIKNLMNKQTAFSSTIILSVSIWFAFSRKIMPDTFSVSLVIIGLYYAYNYLKHGVRLSLILFFVFCTIGMLCKIPSSSLFCVLLILIFIKEIDSHRKLALYFVGALSFLIVCFWYFYWVPHLLDTYHYQLYFPKGIVEGVQEIIPLIPELLEKFYFSSLHSYIALIFSVIGIVLLLKSKQKFLTLGISIITAVFFLFIIKTGAVFPQHNYYIIPFTPIMALLSGYAIATLRLKVQYIFLAIITIEGIANQQHDFFIKDSSLYKLDLENITKEFIPSEDLIVINGGQSPQDIYFSHRKGWTIDNTNLVNPHFIDSLTNLGAKYLVVDISQINGEFIEYQSIYTDNNYVIYKLTEQQK
jgi:hypothetical protein